MSGMARAVVALDRDAQKERVVTVVVVGMSKKSNLQFVCVGGDGGDGAKRIAVAHVDYPDHHWRVPLGATGLGVGLDEKKLQLLHGLSFAKAAADKVVSAEDLAALHKATVDDFVAHRDSHSPLALAQTPGKFEELTTMSAIIKGWRSA
jgi:hypothetical protein